MAFVVDDLVGWLVGLLAEAGRKKLTALVLGSEQERALGRAATAASNRLGTIPRTSLATRYGQGSPPRLSARACPSSQ